MDEYHENLKLQAFSHLIRSQFLKKVTHVLLSFSLFTVFFPHSLPWHSFFHSLGYWFSTLPLQLITHTIDKNCMFILCNGILVLVVTNSGLISSSKSCKINEDNNSSELKSVKLDMKVSLPASDEAIAEVIDTTRSEEFRAEDKFIDVMEENELLTAEICEVEENWIEDGSCYIENNNARDEEEVADDNKDDHNYDEKIGEENAGLSTDELNKKFDEFIRRMKEELRIEARQHLIMVSND